MENSNLELFAKEISKLVDQEITSDHIHGTANGRFYYTQAPEEGAPMLLHHYRGPFFVDIHPNDYKKIESGEISPFDYIKIANWLVGYFWGGGSMLKGGFYKPMDIVGNQTEVREYLRDMAYHRSRIERGYMSTWENDDDPRVDLFEALCRRFESEFSGYTIRGFLCSNIDDDTIILTANPRYVVSEPYSFTAYASESLIRDILMYKVAPEDWDEFSKKFKFEVRKAFKHEFLDATEENIKAVFADVDYVAKQEAEQELLAKENAGLFTRICDFFSRKF